MNMRHDTPGGIDAAGGKYWLRANLTELPISRRELLRIGAAGAAWMLAGRLGRSALAATRPSSSPATSQASSPATSQAAGGKAKSIIQIWMWGGPSHLDTFDPKPEAGVDYCGPFNKPIETNVPGIRICELLPLLAAQADKYALIRSMTHGNTGHETAAYMVQTGRQPGGRVNFPSVGAVVAQFRGYDAGYTGLIPPYVVLTELQGRFSEVGFLGSKCKPFATGGNPSQNPFAVEGVVAPNMTPQRQLSRRELLGKLDTLGRDMGDNAQLTAATKARDAAYDLILGDAGKVFDLSQESNELRDRYGKTKFGQSCLAARRLVERGVPYVTINFQGWDTHKQNFQAMRRLLPELDKGLATLLQDLSDRGLLDSTIIWCSGEFGRTPKVQNEAPWDGGRGHHGKVFSALLAGGGFKGGRVVGTSDAKGEEVKERPVYPCDLIGSMYERMGIDPDGKLPNPAGLDVRVTPDASEHVPSGGRLKEIM